MVRKRSGFSIKALNFAIISAWDSWSGTKNSVLVCSSQNFIDHTFKGYWSPFFLSRVLINSVSISKLWSLTVNWSLFCLARVPSPSPELGPYFWAQRSLLPWPGTDGKFELKEQVYIIRGSVLDIIANSALQNSSFMFTFRPSDVCCPQASHPNCCPQYDLSDHTKYFLKA